MSADALAGNTFRSDQAAVDSSSCGETRVLAGMDAL